MSSHIPITARMFLLVTYAGLVAAGCQTSQGLKDSETDSSGTKVLARQELERWHELKQQMMVGNEPSRTRAIEVPTSATSSSPTRAVDLQVPNHSQRTDQSKTALRGEASPTGDVVLRPGDVVEVKFFYTPELDVTQMVRPDGKITLQLVGEVTAEGRSPGQIREELLSLYRPHLKDPQIAVLVKSLYDRRVFVGGQVIRPGIIDMPGEMTVMEAIMAAGGFDMREAEVESVIVVRQEGNRWQGYKLNMKSTLKGYRTQPFFLCPKDIVYVPRTKIAEVDQWIDEHISKLIPRLPFYFSMPLGQ
jgi:protein involved in polysaccharide export with SLBB domain